MKTSQQKRILIVGAGHLGASLIPLLQARVVAETKTPSRHPFLASLGCQVRLRSHRDQSQFDSVVFCLPPSGFTKESYVDELKSALDLWSKKGSFVFTSSIGVYRSEQLGLISENSPVASHPRASLLIAAENETKNASGLVLRLGGLYSLERGPQVAYLKKLDSSEITNRYLNLVHYDDAAKAVFHLIDYGKAGHTYNATDEHPIDSHSLCKVSLNYAKIFTETPILQADGFSGVKPPWRLITSRRLRDLGWQKTHTSIITWLDRINQV